MSHDPQNPVSNETGEYVDVSRKQEPVIEPKNVEEPKKAPVKNYRRK